MKERLKARRTGGYCNSKTAILGKNGRDRNSNFIKSQSDTTLYKPALLVNNNNLGKPVSEGIKAMMEKISDFVEPIRMEVVDRSDNNTKNNRLDTFKVLLELEQSRKRTDQMTVKKHKVSLAATQVTKCHYLLIYTLIWIYSK